MQAHIFLQFHGVILSVNYFIVSPSQVPRLGKKATLLSTFLLPSPPPNTLTLDPPAILLSSPLQPPPLVEFTREERQEQMLVDTLFGQLS